uniref:G_PROTEIN_RECEP_F1_2 domain-containing protein n=1 Tax=Panagrellus redivivus TaxID=6233 RepID=A0A7E4VFV8_PANRE
MFSVYITVFASIDCYIGVSTFRCFSSLKPRYCTVKNANRCLRWLIVFVALYNVVQFAELRSSRCFDENRGMEVYELCPTELRMDATYKEIYKGYMYTGVMVATPFIFLLILTTAIIMTVKKQNCNHERLYTDSRRVNNRIQSFSESNTDSNQGIETTAIPLVGLKVTQSQESTDSSNTTAQADDFPFTTNNNDDGNNNSHSTRNLDVAGIEDEESSSTAVLVSVVFLFLFCNAVSLMSNVTEILGDLVPREVHMATIDVGNFLVVFNATANFFIYVVASTSFRDALMPLYQRFFHGYFKKTGGSHLLTDSV